RGRGRDAAGAGHGGVRRHDRRDAVRNLPHPGVLPRHPRPRRPSDTGARAGRGAYHDHIAPSYHEQDGPMSDRGVAGTAEGWRLAEDARRERNWKRWGPYLAERQWATVREDYSADNANW